MIHTEHIIKEQAYEIDIENQEEAYELQSSISRLQKSQIQDVLDRVLSSFDNSNFSYQFDCIELNLGTISKSNYENELVYRIEEELKRYLSYTIQENGNVRTGKSIPLKNQKLEALEHFLENGYFAWNASNNFSSTKLLNELVQTQPVEITQLLRRLGKEERIRKRMISQYSDKTLEAIVVLIAQKESNYMIAYKDNVIEQQEKKPLVKTNQFRFKVAIWEIVLAYLFSDKGFYDKKSFLKFLIKKVAQKYTIAYHKLLIILSKAIQKDKKYKNKTIEFKSILLQLTTEEIAPKPPKEDTPSKENLTLYLKQFAQYVNHGTVNEAALFTSKKIVNGYLLKMLKTRDARLLFYMDQWLQISSKKQRILAIISKEVLDEVVEISSLSAIKISKTFLGDLIKKPTIVSSASKTIINIIQEEQTNLIFKQVFVSITSEKKLIYNLLLEIGILTNHSQEDFIQFLSETKAQLSKEHKKIVTQFLNSFEQQLEHITIKTIVSDIQRYTAYSDTSSLKWWLESKGTLWMQKLGISRDKLYLDILTNLKEQEAPIGFINYFQEAIINESKSVRDTSDQNNTSQIILEEVVPYILKNGKIPWWIKTQYSWETFNADLTTIWTSEQSKKRLLTIIIENAHRISYANILDDYNLLQVWEAIDAESTKNNAHLLQEIVHFVKENLVALGSISRRDYDNFKTGAFQALLEATKHKDLSKVVSFIRKWGEDIKIYKHASLFEIYSSILEKYFSKADIYIKLNPSVIVENEVHLSDSKIGEDHNLIQQWQALDSTITKMNASLLEEMHQFLKENLYTLGNISSSHYDTFKAGAFQALLEVIKDKNPKKVIQFIKKWGDDIKVHRYPNLFEVYTSILEKYTAKTDLSIKLDPWISALSKSTTVINTKDVRAISLQDFITSLQPHIYIKNSNAPLENQLEKLRIEYPHEYRELLVQDNFRKALISELKKDELKKIITVSLNTKQQSFYKQAHHHLERYQSYITHQEYMQSSAKFNTLVLLKLSIKGIQAWTQKDWTRIIFHTINQVIGVKKNRSIIFDIQEKLHLEKALYSKENQPLLIQLQKLAASNFENTAVQNKKFIKELLLQKTSILEDLKEDTIDGLLRTYPHYKKAIAYLQNYKNVLSIKEITTIEKIFSNLVRSIGVVTLNSWKIKEWSALLFYSITQAIGEEKRNKVVATIKAQNEVQKFTTELENLSIERQEGKIEKGLSKAIIKSDQVVTMSSNTITIKELDTQVLKDIEGSQIAFYKQTTTFLKTYASYISIQDYKKLTTVFLKFITAQLESNSLRFWKMDDWLAAVFFFSNQVIGKEKHREVIVRFRESVKSNHQIPFDKHLEFFEKLQKLSQKKPKNMIPQDSEKPKEDEKDYKKLGEEAPHEFIDPMFINNAGLIIIAPYLGMLFQKCGLMENSEFKDEHSKHKAVQLLSYASTGDIHQEEHELVLHKVLCGLYVSTPLEATEKLSDTEKQTIEGLLKAVIQHWTALGNTSIEGLRESFLQRQGKLEEEENRYYLQVENKSYDMLLDQIPWSITKINLSWMHKILQVEWRV